MKLIYALLIGAVISIAIGDKGINLNIPDLWYKVNDFVEINLLAGGWHRIGVILGIGLLVYAAIVSWMYFGEKKK